MGGYLDRGALMIDEPWHRAPSLALYPTARTSSSARCADLQPPERRGDRHGLRGRGRSRWPTPRPPWRASSRAAGRAGSWACSSSATTRVSLGGRAQRDPSPSAWRRRLAWPRLADEGRRGDAWRLGVSFGLARRCARRSWWQPSCSGSTSPSSRRTSRRFRRGLLRRALRAAGHRPRPLGVPAPRTPGWASSPPTDRSPGSGAAINIGSRRRGPQPARLLRPARAGSPPATRRSP